MPTHPPYRVAVITGASSGIGRRLAERLAERGVKVALLARRTELLNEVASAIEAAGGTALACPCSVSDRDAVNAAVAKAAAQLGEIDLVIANAGVAGTQTVEEFDLGEVEKMYGVNLFGALNVIGACLPGMIERRRGHVVGVSSLASFMAFPNMIGYSGSKVALNHELDAMRNALRRYGIAVTTLCPGFIRTAMTEESDHRQPMLMDLEPATRRMLRAIFARRRRYAFPAVLALTLRFITALPTPIADRLAMIHVRETRRSRDRSVDETHRPSSS
jgi:short-subunit dehydrogenase